MIPLRLQHGERHTTLPVRVTLADGSAEKSVLPGGYLRLDLKPGDELLLYVPTLEELAAEKAAAEKTIAALAAPGGDAGAVVGESDAAASPAAAVVPGPPGEGGGAS